MATPDVSGVADLLAKTKVKQENEISFVGRGLKLDKAEDAEEIVKAIKECKDMQSLRLEGNTVGVEAAKEIAKALETRQEFERAKWSDMFTGRLRSEIPIALETLGQAIITARARLVEIDLSDNAFGPDGVKACTQLLKSESGFTLEELRFNNNGLGIGGGKILAEALLEGHRRSKELGRPLSLKVFVAGRNRLENAGAKALAAAFQTIGTLRQVAMPQNGIYHAGISALATAFAANKSLQIINLNDNTFAEKGAKAMAQALPVLSELEVVNFGDCLVRSEGAKAMARSLKEGAPKLKELNLSCCEINKESAMVVSECMEDKEHLEKLDLNGNCLGEEGIELVRGILEANGRIASLQSLSDDEGDEEDEDDEAPGSGQEDEEEEEEEEEDEEANVNEGDGDTAARTGGDSSLEVKGTAITPPSQPREDIKVTASEFLNSPTAEKLILLGGDRQTQIINELGGHLEDVDQACGAFLKVASVLDPTSDSIKKAVYQCSDAILKKLFSSSTCDPGAVANSILTRIGLLKSEDKVKPIKDLRGPLLTLQYVIKQSYFPKSARDILSTFMSKPNPRLEACGQARHELLQTLYNM